MLDLSTHTLRKWEQRHQAIAPDRTDGGDRRYSGQHIDRLRRLKTLVDRGHSIGTLAALSDSQLGELGQDAVTGGHHRTGPVRLAVLGDSAAKRLLNEAEKMPRVTIAVHAVHLDDLHDAEADALVLEMGSLGSDMHSELMRARTLTGIDPIAVVYGYGSKSVAEQMSDARTALIRRPLNLCEFERTVCALVGVPPTSLPRLGLPPHRFSRELLGEMAMISPELACECPNHVGQLLIELSDFEQYSAECEITKPHDASIHAMLRRTAATSRALFENALILLAQAEGIDLSADTHAAPKALTT